MDISNQQTPPKNDILQYYYNLGCIMAGLIYLTAIVVGILGLLYSSSLGKLFRHGKLSKKTTTTTITYSPSSPFKNFCPLFDYYLHVPKSYFLHFYISGLCSNFILIAAKLQEFWSVPKLFLLLHLTRRAYECIHVHQWNESAKLHVVFYVGAIVHYLFLPFVLYHNNSSNNIRHNEYGDLQQDSISILTKIAAAGINLWMQYEQYQHHNILADLRRKPHQHDDNQKYNKFKSTTATATTSSTTTTTTTTTTTSTTITIPKNRGDYQLPTRRWFQFVLSPHYLAEIILYASFMVLLSKSYYTPLNASSCPKTLLFINNNKFHDNVFLYDLASKFACYMQQNNHLFFMGWVIFNLSVSAIQTRDWYLQYFPKQLQQEEQKIFAIVPFIL